MEIYNNSVTSQCLNLFKKNISAIVTALDKKIITIALFSLGFLAACYTFAKYFQNNIPPINPPTNIPREQVNNITNPRLNLNARQRPIDFTKYIDNIEELESINFNSLKYPIAFSPKTLNEKKLETVADIFYKNITKLEEAQIILLGERHDRRKHRFLEVSILREYGKNDDILLLEGHENKNEFKTLEDERIFSFDFPVNINFQVNGWEKDLLPLTQMLDSAYNILPKLKLELINEKQKMEENPLFNCSEELGIKIDTTIQEYNFNKSKRDGFLISSVLQASDQYPQKKIFAICGNGHIVEKNTSNFENFNIFDYFPANIKCAAIIFKD